MSYLKMCISYIKSYRDIMLSIFVVTVTFVVVLFSWGFPDAGGCGGVYDEDDDKYSETGNGDQFIPVEDESVKAFQKKKPKINTQTVATICGISASAISQSKTFEWNMDGACPSPSFNITLTNSCTQDITAVISKPNFLSVTSSGADIGANIILKKNGQQGSSKTLNVLPNCGAVTAIGSLAGDVVITAQNSATYSFTLNSHRCGPVTITPTSIAFTALKNGPLPAPSAINLLNNGDLSCSVTCSENAAWLHIKKAFDQPPSNVPQPSSEAWSVPPNVEKKFALYALGTSGNVFGSPIICANTTNGLGDATLTASLALLEPTLSVTPHVQPKIQCKKNGPCLPAETFFTVTNTGTGALTFGISDSSDHVSTTVINNSPLGPGESTNVVVNVVKNVSYVEYVKLEFINTSGIDNGNTTRSLEVSVSDEGRVYAWGYDGQYLGVGSTSYYVTSPSLVLKSDGTPLENIVSVSAGGNHALALDKNGNVWSWGNNSNGQLGRTGNTNYAEQISALSNIIGIVAGSYHSLALKDDNHVYAWGKNIGGQLGDGTLVDKETPVPVLYGYGNTQLKDVVRIDAGDKHSSFINNDGVALGTGYGPASIGVAYTVERAREVLVASTSSIPIMTGAGFQTTIILYNDNLLCNIAANESPPCYNLNKHVETIATGNQHYLIVSNGEVFQGPTYNWGSETQWSIITEIGSFSNVVQIAAGNYFSLAISPGSGLYTWGNSITGDADSDLPILISGTNGSVGVSGGTGFAVILK